MLTLLVPLHEQAHVTTAKYFGCKIIEHNAFSFEIGSSTLGYIIIDCPKTVTQMQTNLIAISGGLLIALIGFILLKKLHPKYSPISAGILAGGLLTMGFDLQLLPPFNWVVYLLFALGIGIGLYKYYEWRK